MSDCIAPECWNTLELSRLRCWNIGGGFFFVIFREKSNIGQKMGNCCRAAEKVTFSKNVTANVTENVTAFSQ